MNGYEGEVVDLEVARYGLRTFKPGPDPWDDPSWLITSWESLLRRPMPDEKDLTLGPVYVSGQQWLDGTCEAECLMQASVVYTYIYGNSQPTRIDEPKPNHQAPHEGCHCGIYACHNLSDLVYQYPAFTDNIIAVIAAEGQTIVGSKGFRTQYARVVAYWCRNRFRTACERQFKYAAPYTKLDEMLGYYNLDS